MARPGSRLEGALFHKLAREYGFRFIGTDRRSTFLPDRQLLAYPEDMASLADGLGLGRFGVMGWSGGGAHTTACAHAIPDRLLFNISFAGYTNFAEWPEAPQMLEGAADRASVRLARWSPWLFRLMFDTMGVYARRWPRRFVMRVKKTTHESGWALFEDDWFVEAFAAEQREAFAQGGAATTMDARVHYVDWGFSIADIAMPIHVFHGVRDKLVPIAFGEHLTTHAPGAILHRVENQGHFFPAMSQHQRQIFESARSLL